MLMITQVSIKELMLLEYFLKIGIIIKILVTLLFLQLFLFY